MVPDFLDAPCRCLRTGCVTSTANPYAFLHTLGRKQLIAKWVGALDTVKMHKALNGEAAEQKPETVQADIVAVPSAMPAKSLLPDFKSVSQG